MVYLFLILLILNYTTKKKYSGKWYGIEHIIQNDQLEFECVTAEYETVENNILIVKNSGKNLEFNSSLTIRGEIFIIDRSKPNHFLVQFFKKLNLDFFKVNYNVWKTDYNQYALVYSCKSTWFEKAETIWILSREKSLDPTITNELKSFLREKGFNPNLFKKINQKC